MRVPVTVLWLIFFYAVSGHKILVYSPKFAYSHTQFMGLLADTLVEAGHEVTILLHEIDVLIRTNGSTKARMTYLPAHPETTRAMKETNENDFCKVIWSISDRIPLLTVALKYAMDSLVVPQCKHLLKQDDLLRMLKEENYTIGITETFDNCGIGLFHALGIKATVTGSVLALYEGTSYHIGNPVTPSYIPGALSPVMDRMGFFERVLNFVNVLVTLDMNFYLEKRQHELFKAKYGPDFPRLGDLISNSQLTFVNHLPYMDTARPCLMKVMELGGITIRPVKPLDEKWESVLAVRNRTVLISFGSIVKSSQMPEGYKAGLIKVISDFPNVTFIWKHEEPIDERILKLDNVYATEWVPQNDLLNRSEVVAFVTHAGANSITEAVFKGKPMLAVPMFADQTRYAMLVQAKGIGRHIHKTELANYKILKEALTDVLNNDRIHQQAAKFARLLKTTNHQPKKMFQERIQLLADMGSLPELDSAARHLSWYIYYSLDVMLFLILVTVTIVAVLIYGGWWLGRKALKYYHKCTVQQVVDQNKKRE